MPLGRTHGSAVRCDRYAAAMWKRALRRALPYEHYVGLRAWFFYLRFRAFGVTDSVAHMDTRVRALLPGDRGVYVEAGALDGVTKSNTLLFARAGWDGLLIEPIPSQAKRCRRFRNAIVEEVILTAPEFAGVTMSIVDLADNSIVESPDGASTVDSVAGQIRRA